MFANGRHEPSSFTPAEDGIQAMSARRADSYLAT